MGGSNGKCNGGEVGHVCIRGCTKFSGSADGTVCSTCTHPKSAHAIQCPTCDGRGSVKAQCEGVYCPQERCTTCNNRGVNGPSCTTACRSSGVRESSSRAFDSSQHFFADGNGYSSSLYCKRCGNWVSKCDNCQRCKLCDGGQVIFKRWLCSYAKSQCAIVYLIIESFLTHFTAILSQLFFSQPSHYSVPKRFYHHPSINNAR
jgi:hypothetical protein